ncbi:hypothetical protein Q8F55_008204 [Vanrija albida]|uniref:Uncharacterized protein n=1 Tax=Vanrija albida TaxID=181172 RepID=A0ABR3PVK3_9TREE
MSPTRTVTTPTTAPPRPARPPRPLSDVEILDLPRPSSDLGHHLDESPASEASDQLSPPAAAGNPFVSTATLNVSSASLPSIAITPSKDDSEAPVSSLTRARAADATSSFYDTDLEGGRSATATLPPQDHRRRLRPLEKVLIGLGGAGFVAGIVLAALYANKSI